MYISTTYDCLRLLPCIKITVNGAPTAKQLSLPRYYRDSCTHAVLPLLVTTDLPHSVISLNFDIFDISFRYYKEQQQNVCL